MTTPEQQAQALVDEAMKLEAQALGLRLQAAKVLGLHDEARQYMREMYAVTQQRRDARFAQAEARGECFFVTAGDFDGGAAR